MSRFESRVVTQAKRWRSNQGNGRSIQPGWMGVKMDGWKDGWVSSATMSSKEHHSKDYFQKFNVS